MLGTGSWLTSLSCFPENARFSENLQNEIRVCSLVKGQSEPKIFLCRLREP